MKRAPNSHHTSRVGVLAIGTKLHRELKWHFREQAEDFGIDALIEIATPKGPTGKIIAAQIKSGQSFFKEKTADGFVFRGEQKHLRYWLRHKLPVIVILYDPKSDNAYWEAVTKETVQRSRKGWKITIPRDQQIAKRSASRLEMVSEGPRYFQRLAKLQLARPWMLALDSGKKRLFIEAQEWVHKSSGRCDISLIQQDRLGNEKAVQEWKYYVFFPGNGFVDALKLNFPWATFKNDEDVYYDADRSRWDEECGHYDKEDHLTFYHTTFPEWSRDQDLSSLRPYSEGGEVANWRFELELNDLGRAFLLLETHMND